MYSNIEHIPAKLILLRSNAFGLLRSNIFMFEL